MIEAYYPMAPTRTTKDKILSLDPKLWTFQLKKNGGRLLSFTDKSGKRAHWSRYGRVWPACKKLSVLQEITKVIPDGYSVEGEWVWAENTLWLYEITKNPSGSLEEAPYSERWETLKQMFSKINPGPGLRLIPHAGPKDKFADKYNLWKLLPYAEGVVGKLWDSTYVSSRSPQDYTPEWLKFRYCWEYGAGIVPAKGVESLGWIDVQIDELR